MPKRTSAAESAPHSLRHRDDGQPSVERHRAGGARDWPRNCPGLTLAIHAADEWGSDPEALQRCCEDIARGDIIVATMLFMEDHFQPLLQALQQRREHCDAMICAMSAARS